MLRIEEIVGNVDDDFRDYLLEMDDAKLRALLADSTALRHLLPMGVSYAEAVTAITLILDYRAQPPDVPPPAAAALKKKRAPRKAAAKAKPSPPPSPLPPPEPDPTPEPSTMPESKPQPTQEEQLFAAPNRRRSPMLIGAFIIATVLLLVLLSMK
jgi:hypothetical protein